MTPAQQERLNEALRHVTMGFAVMSVWGTFPSGTCKCTKGKDCSSPGKHPIPRDGFKAATRDVKRVTTMLSHDSDPNYGIVWPEDDPDDVVFEWDVDGDGWKAQIEALKTRFGPLPPTKTTRSPSGGLHVFYRWPKDVPHPDGNHFHGFVVRWPWRGYVVGPASRINGAVYADVGAPDIATLPLSWAVTEAVRAPLITVSEQSGGYDLPESIHTGARHDEITRFVASRWNKGVSKAEIEASVRAVLIPLMDEAPSEAKLRHDIDEAWDTAVRKWGEPGGSQPVYVSVQTESGTEERAIDALAIESRIERPAALDPTSMPLPTGLAMMLDHLKPITDAPWSSLLLTSVVGLAGLMGGAPTLRWRGRQRLILFGALVGDSNYARKGQAISEVMATLAQVSPLLDTIREPYIPSSGPSFIDTLAEANGQSVLMVATEMGRVLANAARENETLSYDMRDAWDGIPIGGRTRGKGRVSASDYHLSIIGATTPEDLVAKLTETDLRNGWANRWLWFWAERRDGGFDQTRQNVLDAATAQFLRDGIDFAHALGGGTALIRAPFTMTLTPAASAMLDRISAELDVPAHGTIGVLRQRMPPIAVRVAMVAALLDQTREVDVEHLDFGFAMTDYAVQSIRAVFGTRIDDRVAVGILDILRQSPDGWLNTSTIARLMHKSGDRVNEALHKLLAAGLIEREDRPTAGRTAYGYKLRAF